MTDIDWEEFKRTARGKKAHEIIAYVDGLHERLEVFENNPIIIMQRAVIEECDKERLRLHEQIARLSALVYQGNEEINRLLNEKVKEGE